MYRSTNVESSRERSNETREGSGLMGEQSSWTHGGTTGHVPPGDGEDWRQCGCAACQHRSVQREKTGVLLKQAWRGTELCRDPWGEAKAAGKDARGAGLLLRRRWVPGSGHGKPSPWQRPRHPGRPPRVLEGITHRHPTPASCPRIGTGSGLQQSRPWLLFAE